MGQRPTDTGHPPKNAENPWPILGKISGALLPIADIVTELVDHLALHLNPPRIVSKRSDDRRGHPHYEHHEQGQSTP